MKYLLTGSSGFIGSALKAKLEAEGHEVVPFDLELGQNLVNQKQVSKAVRKAGAVIHLAAIADLNYARVYPMETMAVNVGGTINVAYECAKQGKPLYYASTCCVYGNQPVHPVTEDVLPRPAELYACSKLAGEDIIRGFGLMYGLKYNFMRFATIYGEGVRPALGVHIFLGQAVRGEPITVHGDGTQTRTLTHIDDLTDAILALLKSDVSGEAFNFTTEEEVSANQMAEVSLKVTGSKSQIVHVDQRPGQTFRESVSAEKAKRMLGWEAKVKFEDGMRKTYEWFIANNRKNLVYVEPK